LVLDRVAQNVPGATPRDCNLARTEYPPAQGRPKMIRSAPVCVCVWQLDNLAVTIVRRGFGFFLRGNNTKCFFTTLYFAHTEKEQVRRNQRGKNTSDLIARKYRAFGMAIHSKRQDYDSPKEEKVQRKTHTPGSRDPMLGWAIYSK